ncbi:MAG: hypothetical protein EOL91_12260 [Actinobacteria bacterium]|nr:hypothetical protein [Actinomycetota bacterium]
MTQPNQSELERDIAVILGYESQEQHSSEKTKWYDIDEYGNPEDKTPRLDKVVAYLTANYTPNTKLKALIEASEKINLEFNGRPDCKNCSLQEQLAELIKAKERERALG